MPVCQESGVLLWRGALFRIGKHGGHVAGPTEIFQQHHAHQRLDRDLNYWRACGTRQSTGVRGRLPRRHRAPLYLLPMLMRALFGEHLTALRAEIAPHVARTVAFFLAACRQGGIGWTKRQRRQKQGSRTCFVSCCKSHRSRPAVFLFRYSRRAAPSSSPTWRRASRRALRCGQPACSAQWRRRHGSGELPCMQRRFPAASCHLPKQAPVR